MTPAGARPAVLFDVDGTLVDSNYLHVHAWYRAFNDARVDVEAWRIHRSIGMDGSTLVASLAEGADDDTRSRLKDLHSRYYRETAPLLRRLPGARELLEAVDKLGLQIVLATAQSSRRRHGVGRRGLRARRCADDRRAQRRSVAR